MKVQISIHQQSALLDAHRALDAYEAVTPGVDHGAKVVRVPYKLGAHRRALVKNMTALKASLSSYEEARLGLRKECFPDLADDQIPDLEKSKGEIAQFEAELKKILDTKDEIDLLTFPEAAIYNDNEFPALALATLDEQGLIEA